MKNVTRRQFIRRSATAGAFLVVPSYVVGQGKQPPPSERLNIACVGCGGRGKGDTLNASRGNNIVALCDVDRERSAEIFEQFPQARKFSDFRRMFDAMENEIDAVTVSTTDHTHFHIAMWAVLRGKHVYVQKPMTLTIGQARRLTTVAREKGVATMMGNQGHANEGTRLAYEWIRAGAIGPVREVHTWSDRAGERWEQGVRRPTDTPDIPETLDWDLWLGPAPERPYHSAYVPFGWRAWVDFGCGALGDMGCHIMDASFSALDLRAPVSVEAESSRVNGETFPKWSIITYQFPARGDLPPVKMVWYDGGKKPRKPRELEWNRKLEANGQLIIGDKGTIYAPGARCASPRLIPETKMKEFLPNRPPKTLPRSPGHWAEWFRACKGGPAAEGDFAHGGPLTETVLLGNLAVLAGQKIEWDPAKVEVTNVPEANEYVRREYRKGWEI